MRPNRKKSPKYRYHVRVRGFTEVPLFRDNEDKEKYLFLFKKYAKKNNCKIYGYCFMTTHGHFFVDPMGYDISNLMHDVNMCYAQYYNKKYNRHGPVFWGRFDSDPVCSDAYCLALSAYIHNNPKDIIGYRGREEYFYYSSYGIYAGLRENKDNFVDTGFILRLFKMKSKESATKKYLKFVKKQKHERSLKNIIESLSDGEMHIVDEEQFSL